MAEAQKAVEWRNQGRSMEQILRETPFESAFDLFSAMRDFNAALIYEADEDRVRQRQSEINAINLLLAKCWQIIESPPGLYDKEGVFLEPDTKAVIQAIKVAGDLIQKRINLLGLAKEDIREVGREVLVISRKQGNYVKDLQRVVAETPDKYESA